MPRIDLTPDGLKTSQLRQKRLRRWMLAVMAVGVVMFVWTGVKYFSLLGEERALNETAKVVQQTAHQIQQLTQAKNQLDLWCDRIAVLDQLNQYPDYVKITDYLAEHSPALLYLEKLAFSHPEKTASGTSSSGLSLPKSAKMFLLNAAGAAAGGPAAQQQNQAQTLMQLTGRGLDHQAAADYITMLRQSNLFGAVKLKHTRRDSSGPAATAAFEMECFLKPVISFMGVDYADLQQTENF